MSVVDRMMVHRNKDGMMPRIVQTLKGPKLVAVSKILFNQNIYSLSSDDSDDSDLLENHKKLV